MNIIQSILQHDQSWIVQLFFIVLLALFAAFFVRRGLRRLEIRLEKTNNPWDDAFIRSIKSPMALFIWSIGTFAALELVSQKRPDFALEAFLDPARMVIVIGSITWFLLRLINNIELNLINELSSTKKADETTISALARLVRLSILITAALVALQTLGFSVSGVLAFGGIGGIAVGFAAKDLLANFFGGLMIYLDRPFSVGDWVRSPDKDIEGVVEDIGWRLTCIRRFDKRPLYVPNSIFANIAVENPSRMTHRRIYETIGLRYSDAKAVKLIVNDVRALIESHPDLDHKQTMIVNFNEFGPSSLDFFVYAYTKTVNWIKYHEVKQDVLLSIQDIIEKHDAEIAFPTSTMHIQHASMSGLEPPFQEFTKNGAAPDNVNSSSVGTAAPPKVGVPL